MSEVNWHDAPKDAEFYAHRSFRKLSEIGTYPLFFDCAWKIGGFAMDECLNAFDYEKRPTISLNSTEWPETDDRINSIGLNRTTEDTGHYEQAEKPLGNKYDRIIYGKYGTGKCAVDIYRVLDAFETGSAEIDHAVKKLLCAGNRGAKDKLQDLQEAIQSIQAAIDLMKDKEL